MKVYVCSNKECDAVYDFDVKGHCPKCMQSNGGGWSCRAIDVKSAETVISDLKARLVAEPHRH